MSDYTPTTVEEIIDAYVKWTTDGDEWDVVEDVRNGAIAALAAHDAGVVKAEQDRIILAAFNEGGMYAFAQVMRFLPCLLHDDKSDCDDGCDPSKWDLLSLAGFIAANGGAE